VIDYESLLYAPIYDLNTGFGVLANLDLGTSGQFTLTVLDDTQGIMLDEGNGLSIGTIKPAATVRISELAANSLTRASLKQGAISFNNGNWIIVATQPKPLSGAGELYLILEKA
jgi:hypothetical protein